MQKSAKVLGATILLLLLISACIWTAALSAADGTLRVTFLNVGQGDAIFVESPSGMQMLIDGGKNRTVVRELSRVTPWFDRSIDIVVATHPDADHIGGLLDVFKRYDVALIAESSVEDKEGVDAAAFAKAVEEEIQDGAQTIVAERGRIIELGGGAYFEVLFPDRAVPSVETNTGSIVGRLVYGKTAFMLSGDAPDEIERYLVRLDGDALRSDVLKAGHHGSRTSSSLQFVGFVSPEIAVISRGCDNTYGHPHEEVLATFARLDVPVLDTCADGAITFVSNGNKVTRE